MSGEFLVGGSSQAKRARRHRDDTPPPQVGVRFLLTLVLIGGAFVAVGAWRVNTVFAVRNYEMETSRLQEAMRKKSDRTKTLAARVSQLQRGEILKSAAEMNLGMAEPLPAEMETITIDAQTRIRWEAAAAAQSTGKEEVLSAR